jgi:transposase InsO family protein
VKFLRPTHPYIAIATGFVYLAAILDAWSRRVVGYAISGSIDARVAVAALKAAIRVGVVSVTAD